MSVQYHPLDFDALNKGDVIAPELIERIIGKSRDDPKYALAVLALRERIMSELEDRGRPATVRVEDGALKILTDEEAAVYNPSQFDTAIRKAARSHKRTMQIDLSKLKPEERKNCEGKILVNGRMLQAAFAERKKLLPAAHVRTTPGLPG